MTDSRAILEKAARRLQAAGIDTPALDARHLLAFVLGRRFSEIGHATSIDLDDEHLTLFENLMDRRAAREPLQRLVGSWDFWTLELQMGEAGLIPRPDSETLISAVLAHFPDHTAPLRVLDLGTGTGCLLLAALSEYPKASGLGVDISLDAVALAAANAALVGLEARTLFCQGDWGRGLAEKFDLVLSNPPYIPSGDIEGLEPEVARFEPRAALDGGVDGLGAYRCIAKDLPNILSPSGLAVLELGADQAAQVEMILKAEGLEVIGLREDLAGIQRAILARIRT